MGLQGNVEAARIMGERMFLATRDCTMEEGLPAPSRVRANGKEAASTIQGEGQSENLTYINFDVLPPPLSLVLN